MSNKAQNDKTTNPLDVSAPIEGVVVDANPGFLTRTKNKIAKNKFLVGVGTGAAAAAALVILAKAKTEDDEVVIVETPEDTPSN